MLRGQHLDCTRSFAVPRVGIGGLGPVGSCGGLAALATGSGLVVDARGVIDSARLAVLLLGAGQWLVASARQRR